jgi:NADH-ubiquinone oxidoreductase chain 5
LTFFYKTRAYSGYIKKIHELPVSMGVSLMFLGFGSIFVGFLLKDAFVGVGTSFWGNTIFIDNAHSAGFDFEVIPFSLKMFPLVASIFGMCLAYFMYHSIIYMQRVKQLINTP